MKKPLAGFTVVEVVVVITVLGILAAVTMVSYRGVQAEAQDSKIKAATQQVADAVQLWSTRTNQKPEQALFSTNTASTLTGGYVQSGNYAEGTPEETLIKTGYLPNNFSGSLYSKNTPGNNQRRILSIFPCTTPGRYAVYATLNDDSNKAAEQQKANDATCTNTTPWTSYNSNYVVIF